MADVACLRCMTQLNFLKRMHHLTEESHLILQEQTLHVLVGKLEIATALIRRLVKPVPPEAVSGGPISFAPRALKFSFKKDSLTRALNAIETWQRISDPTWFLMLKMTDSRLDTALEVDRPSTEQFVPTAFTVRASSRLKSSTVLGFGGITLPPEALTRMNTERLAFCELMTAAHPSKQPTYILDVILGSNESSYDVAKQNIRDMARKLQPADPKTFNLLSCKGFITEKKITNGVKETVFTLVFRIPPELTLARSLRDLLLSTSTTSSLSHRFEIAQQLANAVCYIHTFGFVHKNIRPEIVLAFERSGAVSPFICTAGFESLRKEDGKTQHLGDDSFGKNLYRHPSRQGSHPETDYVMQHDIYSLGICLLEIGLWQSFVQYDIQQQNPKPSSVLGLPEKASPEEIQRYLFEGVKQHCLNLAHTRLPEVMGTKYSQVVETCLTCLDPGNPDFGDATEFQDEDGIRVGVRYIEKVR
jgi:serine/threonine protein kinase